MEAAGIEPASAGPLPDEPQEDPDLAPADAGESASREGHKRDAASADHELSFIHRRDDGGATEGAAAVVGS